MKLVKIKSGFKFCEHHSSISSYSAFHNRTIIVVVGEIVVPRHDFDDHTETQKMPQNVVLHSAMHSDDPDGTVSRLVVDDWLRNGDLGNEISVQKTVRARKERDEKNTSGLDRQMGYPAHHK